MIRQESASRADSTFSTPRNAPDVAMGSTVDATVDLSISLHKLLHTDANAGAEDLEKPVTEGQFDVSLLSQLFEPVLSFHFEPDLKEGIRSAVAELISEIEDVKSGIAMTAGDHLHAK